MESIVMDLSCGATFTFTIAPDLPQFTFRIVPEVREATNGYPASTVKAIEVFRGGAAREPLQNLTGCDLRPMEPPPSVTPDPTWFHAEDVNFDGFQDIYLGTMFSPTGNQSGCIWLYTPETGQFEYSKDFSQLGRHWLDSATKTILEFEHGGGAVYNAAKYEVENNRPLKIYSEVQDWYPGTKQFHCVVQERRGNVLKTIRDESAETTSCDPSPLMREYIPNRYLDLATR